MWNPVDVLIALEAILAVAFLGSVFLFWRKTDAIDAGLWVLVWATRVFASIEGVKHLPPHTVQVIGYVGLQVCSASALILILTRSELRVLKERLRRVLLMRLRDTGVSSSRA